MLEKEILREAAFQLLASSTIRRYMREARRLANEHGLVERFADPEPREHARRRLVELLRQLEGDEARTPSEFEAALLLTALARTEIAVELLSQAANTPATWIRALARRLQAVTPPNSEQIERVIGELDAIPITSVEIERATRMSDQSDPRLFPRAA